MELLSGAKYRKYELNEKFFCYDLLNEKSAYWLGMLASDGSVEAASSRIKLELARKDEAHVIKFKTDIGSSAPLKYAERISFKDTKPSFTKSARIRVSSKYMVETLVQYNIIPNKTYLAEFPEILTDHHLLRHYLRGVFDGDGCICGKAGKHHNVIFIGRTAYIERLAVILKDKLGIDGLIAKRNVISLFTVYRDAYNYKLLNYMYDGATVYLDRKYIKSKAFTDNYHERRVDLDLNALKLAYAQNPDCVALAKQFECSNSSIKRTIINNNLGFIAEKQYKINESALDNLDFWKGFAYLSPKIKNGAAIRVTSSAECISDLKKLLEIENRSDNEKVLCVYSRGLIANIDNIIFNGLSFYGFLSRQMSIGKRHFLKINSTDPNKIVTIKQAIINIIGLQEDEVELIKNSTGLSLIVKNKEKVKKWFFDFKSRYNYI